MNVPRVHSPGDLVELIQWGKRPGALILGVEDEPWDTAGFVSFTARERQAAGYMLEVPYGTVCTIVQRGKLVGYKVLTSGGYMGWVRREQCRRVGVV